MNQVFPVRQGEPCGHGRLEKGGPLDHGKVALVGTGQLVKILKSFECFRVCGKMSVNLPFRMERAGTRPPPSRPKSGGSQGPGTDKGSKNDIIIQKCRFESSIWLF